ncbi:RrF2 family transcriptional regulator [Coraliomargarita sp. W4R53]
MKLLSDASEYALRGVVWLAQREGQTFKLRDIAAGTQAAPGYLIKVLQNLSKAGIISAQRGSSGGFSLIRKPGTLSVLEIINAVDPIERIHTCPLGLKSHGTCLCPMHKQIDDAMAAIEATFKGSTVADLLNSGASSVPMSDGPLPDAASPASVAKNAKSSVPIVTGERASPVCYGHLLEED